MLCLLQNGTYFEALFPSNLLSEICPHFLEWVSDTVKLKDFNIRDKSDYMISNHC